MKRFDWHKWNAEVYRTPEELDSALNQLGVKRKKIKEVHTIGMAYNMQPWSYTQTMLRTLASVGIPYDDIYSGAYPRIDRTLVPCEVEICEPVVFVFEDGSTFEAMPIHANGLKMSVNQIPATVSDGINTSNFDSSLFFSRIIGATIDHIETIECKTTSFGTSSRPVIRRNITYQFRLRGGEENIGCYFRQAWEGWFNFGLTLQNHLTELGNKTADISFGEIEKAAKKFKQILIVEGHDSSSYFWIMPVKHVEKTDKNRSGIEEYRPEQISIEEADVFEFLYYFLDKYFDHDYPYGDAREEYCSNEFEWHLEYNIYTYNAINQMLADIEQCSELLITDYTNPALDGLKQRYSVYTFDVEGIHYTRALSENAKAQIIHDNIYIATDFYGRFVARMRSMMENAPDYELISFKGP